MLNVCVLTWEYPPKVVEGIAYHSFELSKGLAIRGIATHIVTHDPERWGFNLEDEVRVHRVFTLINGNNLLNWVFILNYELKREAVGIHRVEGFDIIHAHDWMTVPAALTLKHVFRKPLILTVHSTEEQRCSGISSDYSQAIKTLEQQGVYEASRVITTNEETKYDVVFKFGVPQHKVEAIQPFKDGWIERVLSVYEIGLIEGFNP